MSTEAIYDAVIRAVLGDSPRADGAAFRHLDVGAGRGELIDRMRTRSRAVSSACDFQPARFRIASVECLPVDLNASALPFASDAFDAVTCSEVVEHLENYRHALRECFRVLAPGGIFVATTPNVLNSASRVRYLTTGFAKLFGPLPVANDRYHATSGHITPIPYFYLAHALLDAGFDDVRVAIDKVQRTSVMFALLVAPLATLAKPLFFRAEGRRWKTLTPGNAVHVARHFQWQLLVGRTIVVSGRKAAATPRIAQGQDAGRSRRPMT